MNRRQHRPGKIPDHILSSAEQSAIWKVRNNITTTEAERILAEKADRKIRGGDSLERFRS